MWEKQRELAADMGIHLGDNPDDVDVLVQRQMLEELRDELEADQLSSNEITKDMMERYFARLAPRSNS